MNPHIVNILCLGDSLTAGDGNPSAYRYPLFRLYAEGGIAFRFLGACESADRRMSDAYNRHCGHCGAVIGEEADENLNSLTAYLKKEDHIAPLKEAEILLLYIGTNDKGRKLAEGVEERFLHLLDVIYAINPTVTVYAMTVLTKQGDSDFALNPFLLGFDTADYAAKTGRDLHIVDANGLLSPNGADPLDYPSDDGHPATRGNEKYAQLWYDATAEELRRRNREGTPSTEAWERPQALVTDLSALTLRPREGKRFTARVLPPSAAIGAVRFHSSAPEVLSVDECGWAHAKRAGQASVTVYALDGGLSRTATLTVEGEPLALSEGMTPLFETEFQDAAPFVGETRVIRPTIKLSRVAYPYNAIGSFSTKEIFPLSGDFVLDFTLSHTPPYLHGDENYLSLIVGGIELCIRRSGERIELREATPEAALPSEPVDEAKKTELTPFPQRETFAVAKVSAPPRGFVPYTLRRIGGRAEIYMNGVLLVSAETKFQTTPSPIRVNWYRAYSVYRFSSLRLLH